MSILSVYLLCQYLCSVPEDDRDFFVPVHHNELDYAAPKAAVKFTGGTILGFQSLDEVRQPFALRFFCRDGGHRLIVPLHKPIVAFLVLVLALRDKGILHHDVLCHFHKHRHFFLQLALFYLQGIGGGKRLSNDLRIGDGLSRHL